MYKKEIKRTISTPHVVIDEENSYFMMEGESFPENVGKFYSELTTWLTEYLKADFKVLKFDCHLIYFNSSTSKLLMNILNAMNDAAIMGKNVVVNWHCSKDNDIIIECGEEFGEDFTDLEFHIITQ